MNINANVVDVSVQNFQQEVVEKSKQIPVLVEFYVDGGDPSQASSPILKKLADEYKGKFLLARVDAQQNSQIVQQLGVKSLPTIKVIFQGQLSHEAEGPQDELVLRQLLDQLTMSPVERVREQIKNLQAEGDSEGAIDMLRQAIDEEPSNFALQVELADILIMSSRLDEAEEILAKLAPDTEGINKPKNRLKFIARVASMPNIDELNAQLATDPDSLKLRYQLAIQLIVSDQLEAALDELLIILKNDKDFDDEVARKTMIEVFDLLGKGDPIAMAYRRKMFAFLH